MTAKPRLLVFIAAFFAERTIEKVIRRIPSGLNEKYAVEVLIIDDSSQDETASIGLRTAQSSDSCFKITVLHNPVNQGYGGNQKIGYHYAIKNGFDFVVLLHGDGQYAPELLPDLVEPLRRGEADAVFGSRMMKPRDALKGGMPLYKFIGNRVLTATQNRLLKANLTEFHSGYRAYSVAALQCIPFERNANVFHFDTEIIIQLLFAGKRIKEIPIPTYYGDEICYVNGIKYAAAVVKASLQAKLQGAYLFYDRRFDCMPETGAAKYPSKLGFDSTHSRVVQLVPEGARVLDIACGSGAVAARLKETKGCYVIGCDIERGPLTPGLDQFILCDVNQGLPELQDEHFDCILALDIIEHLKSPEDFLDRLRRLAARSPGCRVILTTANISFIAMRMSLLLGRFEYGKRGILDLTHTRLFTLATLRRALHAAGFDPRLTEGVTVPLPFLLGDSLVSRALMKLSGALARLWPTMFGYQLLVVAEARPTLATLLTRAESSVDGLARKQKVSDPSLP